MLSSILVAALLAAGQTAPVSTNKPAAADPDKKVCKTIKEFGSRLGSKRECKTQAEWDRAASEMQAKALGKMGVYARAA